MLHCCEATQIHWTVSPTISLLYKHSLHHPRSDKGLHSSVFFMSSQSLEAGEETVVRSDVCKTSPRLLGEIITTSAIMRILPPCQIWWRLTKAVYCIVCMEFGASLPSG